MMRIALIWPIMFSALTQLASGTYCTKYPVMLSVLK